VKALAGRRVLVTRPREQAEELAHLLEAAGAEAISAPLIRIEPPLDPTPLQQAAARVDTFNWVVLASVNAVDAFMQAAGADGLRPGRPTKFCAIGPATAAHLLGYGIRADLVPAESTAEGIVSALLAAGATGKISVLIPRADIGRDHTARALEAAGAAVTEVVAYRTVQETSVPAHVGAALRNGGIHIVTFTSASAVRAFAQIFSGDTPAVLSRTTVAVIGPTTAQAAAAAGMSIAIQPTQYTVPALVDAIVKHYAK
jgi:uroporphyrinogen III methyltransferase/synthase